MSDGQSLVDALFSGPAARVEPDLTTRYSSKRGGTGDTERHRRDLGPPAAT